MNKVRLATVWLDGCSGCHMSLLDMDDKIIDLANYVDLVYSPIVDVKEFPENVDVTLVEGAISSVEDLEKIHIIRERTKILATFGDCAVTGNVPSMRNPFGVEAILNRTYIENTTLQPQIPTDVIPALLPLSRPVHSLVNVDLFLPGCPPPAQAIYFLVTELLKGYPLSDAAMTELGKLTRFGK